MSISILWRKVSPTEGTPLPGVSSDWEAYQSIFGRRNLTAADEEKLRGLMLVAGDREGFWAALYEAVSKLDEGEEITVWAEW